LTKQQRQHPSAQKQDEEQALSVKSQTWRENKKRWMLPYFDKLKQSSVDVGVSYEGRVRRRKEEIQSHILTI